MSESLCQFIVRFIFIPIEGTYPKDFDFLSKTLSVNTDLRVKQIIVPKDLGKNYRKKNYTTDLRTHRRRQETRTHDHRTHLKAKFYRQHKHISRALRYKQISYQSKVHLYKDQYMHIRLYGSNNLTSEQLSVYKLQYANLLQNVVFLNFGLLLGVKFQNLISMCRLTDNNDHFET